MKQKNYSNCSIPADVREFAMRWMKSTVEDMVSEDEFQIEAILFDNFSHFISFLHDQWRVLDDEPTYLEGLLAQFPGAEDIDWTGFIKDQMNNMNPVIALTHQYQPDTNDWITTTELYEVKQIKKTGEYYVDTLSAEYTVMTKSTGAVSEKRFADFQFENEDGTLNWYGATDDHDIETGFCFNDLRVVGNSVYSADWFEGEDGLHKSYSIVNFSEDREDELLEKAIRRLYMKYQLTVIGSELIDEQ